MFMFMHYCSIIVIANSVLSGMLDDLLKVDFAITDATSLKIIDGSVLLLSCFGVCVRIAPIFCRPRVYAC